MSRKLKIEMWLWLVGAAVCACIGFGSLLLKMDHVVAIGIAIAGFGGFWQCFEAFYDIWDGKQKAKHG